MIYIGFHRKMEEFVFDSYVKKRLSVKKMMENFQNYKLYFTGQVNFGFFNDEYCKEFMVSLYRRMEKERKTRELGFTKEKDFKITIIKRFAKNKSTWAFLPQENIAKVWGKSQRTISRYLQKMVEEGYLALDKRHNYKRKKAAEYRLASKGLELFRSLFGSMFDKVKSAVTLFSDVIIKTGPDKKEIEAGEEAVKRDWYAWLKANGDDYDPFPKRKRVEIPF